MQFQQKKVLLIGATSGIGRALADKFISTGTSVIAVGRRKDKLDEFAKHHENANIVSIDTAVFDIGDLKAIPSFASDMFKKHPDIDCVFLNSGLQRKVNWAESETVDLDTIEIEMKVNYLSYMHLVKAFLPLLQKQAPKEASMIFTSSGLALIPMAFCPNYCATKVSQPR